LIDTNYVHMIMGHLLFLCIQVMGHWFFISQISMGHPYYSEFAPVPPAW